MSGKIYNEEEKVEIVEEWKNSGLGTTLFAREKGIPESTLRGWVKEDREMSFGTIDIKESKQVPNTASNRMIFSSNNIRIELKDGFDKEFLRKMVEVLINDK